jgi:hypothetical protein
MAVAPPDELCAVCDALYGWRGRELLGAKDVLCWVRRPKDGRFGIAFYGDALKMKLRALGHPLNNADANLDLSLQRALGYPAAARRERGFVHPAVQTMEYPDPYISGVIEGIESLCNDRLGMDGAVDVTLMPLEGSPWSPDNDPTAYYSAKTGKLGETKRPEWLIEVDARDGQQLGANYCAIAQRISHCRTAAVAARFVGRRAEPFLVTHCSGVFERYGASPQETAKAINACGGFLYPSTAVAPVPATNFGELVFVCDPSIILPAMRPYKQRGRWPVAVYDTDVWTETTGYFFGEGAVELLQELTDVDPRGFISKSDFCVLGPAVDPQANVLVPSTKKLRTTLAKRAKLYTRDLDADGLEQVRKSHFEQAAWYSFLEAKVAGIAAMGCYPLAVCPKPLLRKAQSHLTAIGFTGDIISIERPPEVAGRNPKWDYAWRVRDAVLAYAERAPSRFVLDLEE